MYGTIGNFGLPGLQMAMYGLTADATRDSGAAATNPEYARIKAESRARGSLDGTPATATSSMQEDQFNQARATAMFDQASDDVLRQVQRCSPQERLALLEE